MRVSFSNTHGSPLVVPWFGSMFIKFALYVAESVFLSKFEGVGDGLKNDSDSVMAINKKPLKIFAKIILFFRNFSNTILISKEFILHRRCCWLRNKCFDNQEY